MTSKARWLACTIITLGVISSLFIGGRVGLASAVICFGVGAWYLGSRSKFTIRRKGNETQPLLEPPVGIAAKQPTEVLITVKEIHAYSPSAIGGEEALAKNPKLELEVFIHAWLVSETETAVRIKDAQLTIRNSQAPISAERIAGDLDKWYLDADKEESDMWDTHIERVRERLAELNTSGPLECGVPREGWLHFRVPDISPHEYKTADMELCVEDSCSIKHVGAVNSTRYFSGQVPRCELGDPPHISPMQKQVAKA